MKKPAGSASPLRLIDRWGRMVVEREMTKQAPRPENGGAGRRPTGS
jgi:hypothetical protein